MTTHTELTLDELKVLRRLSKGPATSVDRFVASRLVDRGLAGRISGIAWTFCSTPAGNLALVTAVTPPHHSTKFLSAYPDSFAA